MRKWLTGSLLGILGLAELFVSAALHLAYGFYIFAAADLSQALAGALAFENCAVDGGVGDEEEAVVLDGAVPPIVLVHGIFGFGKGRLGGMSYFAGAEKDDDRVLVPNLGSLTSVHDRARELFYYLKGGRVDYGEEHSTAYRRYSRFGRTYARGHYDVWDEEHPVHFVGHSAGAQVIRLLQQMPHDKALEGYADASEKWVLSVTSLSGALNGTTRAYLDLMQPEDGRSLKAVCLLQICRVGSILYHWLDVAWLKGNYDFGFDHFRMSWRAAGVLRGLAALLLAGSCGPFATGDWMLPDLTIQGAARINEAVRTFPCTFYFSYASKRTARVRGVTVPAGVLRIHPLLFIRVMQMCRWRHPVPDRAALQGLQVAV